MSYVEVPAGALREMFQSAGFSLVQGEPGHEEVYERKHHRNALYCVRVYSTIPRSAGIVRGRGRDAIRVVVLLITPHKTYGIAKMKRVFRSAGSQGEEGVKEILERLRERMREAYGLINERLKKEAQEKRAS